MRSNNATASLTKEQAIQEAEYAVPQHWLVQRAVKVRYGRLSALLADRILRNLADGGAIVDVGCGDGKGTFDLHNLLGPKFEVRGVDYSERAIALARAMTYGSGLCFDVVRAQDMKALLASQVTAGLVYREIVEHLTDDEANTALKTAYDILRPGGIVLVTVPSTNTPVSEKHYMHYTETTLRSRLETGGFEVLEIIGFGFRPRWLCAIGLCINTIPKLWRVFNPMWRPTDPKYAHTLLAVARKPG